MIFFIYGYLCAGLPIFICETFTFTVFLIIVIVGAKHDLTFIVIFAFIVISRAFEAGNVIIMSLSALFIDYVTSFNFLSLC